VDQAGDRGRHDLSTAAPAGVAVSDDPADSGSTGNGRADGGGDAHDAHDAAATPAPTHAETVPARLVGRLTSWTTAHLLTLAFATVVLAVANRNQWFFGDEWAFIASRGPGFAELDLFRPHNDHWSTIPLLVYWALLSLVGLKSYLPYAAALAVMHLGLTHLLWRACLRAGVRPAIATGLAGVFAVLGAGAENLLWAFQMGFVGAVAFGWAAVLLHDHDGRVDRRDVAGWLASVAALMCSGPALVMVGVATLTVWLRRRRLADAALTAAVPALVFAIWWAAEGRHANQVPSQPGDRWGIVEWAWTGLAHAAETIVGVPGTGGFLVLALLVWWARHLDLASGRAALALAATVGAFVFYLLTATGRVSLGLEAAEASRYVYIAAALLLPATALVVTRLVPDGTGPTMFVLAVCGIVAFYNIGLLRSETSEEMNREQAIRGSVVAAADGFRDPDHVAANQPGGDKNPDLTAADLIRIDGYGWLPDGVPVTPTDELTAEAVTEVALVRADGDAPLSSVRLDARGVAVAPVPSKHEARCVEVRPAAAESQVALASEGTPWRVRLESVGGVNLRVHVENGTDAGEPVKLTAWPGASDLVSGVGEGTVVVTIPGTDPLTFCGVAPAG
jgi:hypothetical protein